MNLFEEWEATEKRTQASQASSDRSRSSTLKQQQQRQQYRPQPPVAALGTGIALPDSQGQRRQQDILGSSWGQHAPTPPILGAPSSQSPSPADIPTNRAAAGSGTNPFTSAAPSSNPFASNNPFSANPFLSSPGASGKSLRAGVSAALRPRAQSTGLGRSDGAALVDTPQVSNLPTTKRGDAPIFSLQKLNLGESFREAPPSWLIVAVAVGNGTLAMATSDCSVIRSSAAREGEPEEVEISKCPGDAIHKIFLDPTGNHLLACLDGGETYYLHASSPRPKRLIKWSGVVEAVAFDAQRCNEVSTKGIVVGTRAGDLYECSLESNGKERAFSFLYSLGSRQQGSGGAGAGGGGPSGGRDAEIGGGLGGGAGARSRREGGVGVGGGAVAALHLESMSAAVHGETRVFVMVVTVNPLRLHIFLGGPTLEIMFRERRESTSTSFRELPGSMLDTELHVYRRVSGGSTPPSSARLGDGAGAGGSKAAENAAETESVAGKAVGGLGYKDSSPQSFAVLTSMGIYHGSLAVGSQATSDTAITEAQLLPYPQRGDGGEGGGEPPLSMAITEFHFLLLYSDRLQVVSRLNGAVVQVLQLQAEVTLESQVSIMGPVLTLLTDPFTGAGGAMQAASPSVGVSNRLWLFKNRFPYKVRVSHEGRDVWMLFLEKALGGEEAHFESAAQYCKNATERAQVHYVQAGWYFRRGQHTLAARYYAKTPCCFEEIALKFMECDGGWKSTALKTYLQERLRHLSNRQGEHKMQRTMLCTWLTELYLRGFTYLPLEWRTAHELDEAEFSLAEELRAFLRGHVTALDRPTTMALLTSHGRPSEALFYATLVEDYDRVLAHHTNNGPDYKAALKVLRKAPFDKVESLVYKYSASLMAADPAGTIETWMSMPQLKPTKLIPALVRYSQRRKAAMLRSSIAPTGSQQAGGGPSPADSPRAESAADAALTGEDLAIKYLEFCVNELKLKDAAIHNHLLALYAQDEEWRERSVPPEKTPAASVESPWGTSATVTLSGGDDPDDSGDAARGALGSVAEADSGKMGLSSSAGSASSSALLEFINRPADERCFDDMYALRLCSQHGRSLACVRLYSSMKLWEEAVDLALTVDTDMAKANANNAPDPETRKLLWLKIARREVERCRSVDIEEAMRVLQECDLLKIEDILPFFPDFVEIDSFRNEICLSLEEYNGKIESLRKEMEDYTLSTEAVQAEIAELKQRSMYVSSNQTCELCGRNILSTQFYVFPCGHAFRAECLIKYIRPHLSAEQQAAVSLILDKIAAAEGAAAAQKQGAGDQSNRPMPSVGGAGSNGAILGSNLGLGLDGVRGSDLDGSKRAQLYLQALQTELDGYIAAECPLCGDIMVQSLNKPLVTEEEETEVAER